MAPTTDTPIPRYECVLGWHDAVYLEELGVALREVEGVAEQELAVRRAHHQAVLERGWTDS